MDAKMIAIITPSEIVHFTGDILSGHSYTKISLSNPSERRVYFKIKTTKPERYCVSPSQGIIEQGLQEKLVVKIKETTTTRQEISKDKFLLQFVYVDEVPGANEDAAKAFQIADKKYIMKQKLRVSEELIESSIMIEESEIPPEEQSKMEHFKAPIDPRKFISMSQMSAETGYTSGKENSKGQAKESLQSHRSQTTATDKDINISQKNGAETPIDSTVSFEVAKLDDHNSAANAIKSEVGFRHNDLNKTDDINKESQAPEDLNQKNSQEHISSGSNDIENNRIHTLGVGVNPVGYENKLSTTSLPLNLQTETPGYAKKQHSFENVLEANTEVPNANLVSTIDENDLKNVANGVLLNDRILEKSLKSEASVDIIVPTDTMDKGIETSQLSRPYPFCNENVTVEIISNKTDEKKNDENGKNLFDFTDSNHGALGYFSYIAFLLFLGFILGYFFHDKIDSIINAIIFGSRKCGL